VGGFPRQIHARRAIAAPRGPAPSSRARGRHHQCTGGLLPGMPLGCLGMGNINLQNPAAGDPHRPLNRRICQSNNLLFRRRHSKHRCRRLRGVPGLALRATDSRLCLASQKVRCADRTAVGRGGPCLANAAQLRRPNASNLEPVATREVCPLRRNTERSVAIDA